MRARKDRAKYGQGWLVICGWQALVASSAYLSANTILTLVTMNHPGYSPTQWQGTLLYWAIMAIAILVNILSSTSLPKLELFFLTLHILGFFAFLIPMVYVGYFCGQVYLTCMGLTTSSCARKRLPRQRSGRSLITEEIGQRRLCRSL